MSATKEIMTLVEGARGGNLLALDVIKSSLQNPPPRVDVPKLMSLAVEGEWKTLSSEIAKTLPRLVGWPTKAVEQSWCLAFAHLYLWAERGEEVSA